MLTHLAWQWGAEHACWDAGCLMISEWWASEVAVMSAGLLPDAQRSLSAMAIYQNTNALCFMVKLSNQTNCRLASVTFSLLPNSSVLPAGACRAVYCLCYQVRLIKCQCLRDLALQSAWSTSL